VTGSRRDPPILSLAEAIGALESPYRQEEFSTAAGIGVLVVDLPAEDREPLREDGIRRTRRGLQRLACPSIAIRRGSVSAASLALIDEFDLVATDGPAQLDAMLAGIASHPQASLALVQLLRHNAQLDIHQGLIAESLVYSVLQSGPEFAAWRASRKIKSVAPVAGPAVLVSREGSRLSLGLNRPKRHNAFSAELRDALAEALALAVSDQTIGEIVLRGEGPSFCSGGDLDEFGSFPDPATAHVIRSARNPARLLASVAERTVVRVHGACIGAGCELPAFASHVIAEEGAFFQLPEVSLGLVPGAGGTVSLPRRIGRQRTALLALTQQRLDRESALAWGLVDALA
jgi:enoyl-CoA hydratase